MEHFLPLVWLATTACILPSATGTLLKTILNQLTGVCYVGASSHGLFPPESPEKINTSFILFTRNSNQTQTLDARKPEDVLTVWSNFESRTTHFLIHGYMTKVEKNSWMERMKNKLLKKNDSNVIVVNWNGGNQGSYGQAAVNTQTVGAQIALFLNNLIGTKKINAEDVHIIGHSFGAHIAGFAGKKISNLSRISGLDPAGPGFQCNDPRYRLDKSDAVFVDTIISNGDGFGSTTIRGHANFKPNNGIHQPGCTVFTLPTDIKNDGFFEGILDVVSCSHSRSYEYYIESINSTCSFIAYPRDNLTKIPQSNDCGAGCNVMGFHARKPANGQVVTYNLKTADKPPFCIQQ